MHATLHNFGTQPDSGSRKERIDAPLMASNELRKAEAEAQEPARRAFLAAHRALFEPCRHAPPHPRHLCMAEN